MNNGPQKPENANQAQAPAEQASAEVRSEGEANAPTEVGTNREAEAQMLSQALAVRIAKFYALEQGAHDAEAPSYLPRTLEQLREFEPHDWVVTAIMAGYRLGKGGDL